MYMGFQYQDRISQMMALLEGDMVKLQQTLQANDGSAPDLAVWLAQLEGQYAMREQHEHHSGMAENVSASGDSTETTFF
jgi:methyl-accepting chemotaxis protein